MDNQETLIDSDTLTDLKEALKLLNTRSFMFFLLKIEHCNGMYGVHFSDANCYTDIYSHEDSVVLYPFMNVFTPGKDVLQSCIERNEMPLEKGAHIAMENLLKFFKNRKDTEKKLDVDEREKESDWALRLVHHMLSKLAVSSTYVVDNHYQNKVHFCPCCKENLHGDFGDTSIGHRDTWHGSMDIFLANSVAINICNDHKIAEEDLPSTEVKKDCWINCDSQLLARTIVFSFVQKKYHPDHENYLFPTITLSKDEVVLCFYDSEHDVLIRSAPLRLLDRGLNLQTVLALWLTINYKYFCSGITQHMKQTNYTADFVEHVGGKRSVYEKKLKLACGLDKCGASEDDFDPGTSSHVEVIEDDAPLKKPRLC